MRLSSLFKLAVVAAIAVAIALVAAAKSIDVNRYRDFITAQVKAATGRSLTISGPLELKIGLVPKLVATGITFGNMPGGSRPAMATIERIEAEVALLPLLSRQVQVRRLVVTNPDILIETDAKGHGNWVLGGAEPAQAGTGVPPTRFDAREIKIKNARVTWRDGATGTMREFDIHRLGLLPQNGASGPLNLEMKLEYRQRIFNFTGLVGAPAAIGRSTPWPLRLKVATDGMVVAVDGTAIDPVAGKGLDLKLSGQGDELAELLKLAEVLPVDSHAIGPFKAQAVLKHVHNTLALEEIDLALGKRDTALVSAKGNVKSVAPLSGVDLAVVLESDNPGGLSRLTGAALPALGPVKLAGSLADSANGWRLSDLKAAIGHSDLHGDLALDLSGKLPRLTGGLRAGTLALADFSAPSPAKPADGRLFSADPLPLDSLRAAELDVSLAAAKLVVGSVTATDMSADIQLKNGRLAAKPVKGLLAGGPLDGELSLDTGGAAQLRLSGSNIDLGRFAPNLLNGGRTDLKLDLAGKGTSLRALMAGLSGSAVASVGEGRIHNRAVDWAGGDALFQVLGALNPLAKSDDTTQMQCGVVNFSVKNGVATAAKGIAMESAKVDVVGAGTVDLRTEQLDLGFSPRARQGLGVSIGGQVAGLTRLRGTLAEPALGIDELGTARTAASVGAAVATGGLSLVGEFLFDKVTADSSPCKTALGQTSARKGKAAKGGFLDGLFGR